MKTIDKPWGKEEVLELGDRYMVKRLTMWKDHRCSLQFHRIKRETIYVLSGRLRICFGLDQQNLESRVFEVGESLTLPTGVIHRMEAVEDCVYLEASTPEMDDVVRLADDYQRDGQ
jgi:mannose-6-phosphate isomerase-like protein (cupin superfamily)